MSKGNKAALGLIAVIAILLLLSLIGNVVLLSMLTKNKTQLTAVRTQLTDAQFELAQYKSGRITPEDPEAEPAEEPAEPTEEPAEPTDPTAEPAEEPTGEPSGEPTEEPPAETPVPTAVPTATPAPTPAGPYAGSKLDYEPLDSEKLPEVKHGIVVCTVDVNVRSGPGTNYTKLASVSSGNDLKVHASAYGWFLIEYKKEIYGWISGQYFFGDWMFENGLNSFLKDIDPAKEYLSAPEKIVVTAENGANARSGANTNKELVKRLDNGAECVWIGTDGDWRLCDFQGSYGWIHKSNFK